jgi:hypothetical protein
MHPLQHFALVFALGLLIAISLRLIARTPQK